MARSSFLCWSGADSIFVDRPSQAFAFLQEDAAHAGVFNENAEAAIYSDALAG